jgi:hypothetical protein
MTEPSPAAPTAPGAAAEHEPRLTATVNGTIVAAGVLTVSAADPAPNAFDAAWYTLATVIVFWLAHGWAHGLGMRAARRRDRHLLRGLIHELPVLRAVVPPLAALFLARLLGAEHETAITLAAWVCVGELGLLGAGVAIREGEPVLGILVTALGCATLGVAMIALKAIVG